MPIHFYCPLGHRLVVPDERAGKKGRCPQCHQKVYVPVANPQPGGAPRHSAADQAIELDQAGGVPPMVLDAPAAGATARGNHSGRQALAGGLQGAAHPQAVDEIAEANDPLVLAMNEIAAVDHAGAMVYMHPRTDLLGASSSVSKWLPPRVAIPETGAAAAPVTSEPATAPAAPASPAIAPPAMAPPAMTTAAVPSVPWARASQAAPPQAARPPVPAIQVQAQPSRRGWIRAADPDEIDRGYRPDGTRLHWAYLLAGTVMVLALLASWPGLVHFRRTDAPAWVGVVLLMSAAQLVYVVWLLSLPDWATLRIGMMLCAVCAAAYAAGLALVVATPASRAIVLGLADVRTSAGLWCAIQCGLLGVACYGFGHEAGAWREDVREMSR